MVAVLATVVNLMMYASCMEDSPAVYELYAQDGTALYVGIARHIPSRFKTHRATKPWWNEVDETRVVITRYETDWDAALAERERITAIRPRYNRSGVVTAHALYPVRGGRGNEEETPVLRDLRELGEEMRAMPARRAELIAQARQAGHSWPTIGRALGMSHQAAMKAAKPAQR